VPTDVSKIDEVNRLKDRAYAAFGAVDVLMNNAGTSRYGRDQVRLENPLRRVGLPPVKPALPWPEVIAAKPGGCCDLHESYGWLLFADLKSVA
jgi:NAD(P)-dependent dehydrogenase (short-subunit alcohol dehydrogenase family)